MDYLWVLQLPPRNQRNTRFSLTTLTCCLCKCACCVSFRINCDPLQACVGQARLDYGLINSWEILRNKAVCAILKTFLGFQLFSYSLIIKIFESLGLKIKTEVVK